jgi:dTDP-4-amino-4,6-dideoxygalactose transaminase
MIPLPPRYPTRRREVIAAALAQLEQGDWTRLEGAPELEGDLAAWHGPSVDGRAALPWFVASGTAALEAILLGHGIGPGDEVITTPCTWGATVAAILAIGAIPVFCDILPESGLMDPATIPSRITPRTRAVLTVHLYGHPVDCRTLRRLCDERGLLLFEDGSQAHGGTFDGIRVGNWGDAAAFSCMGLKLLAGTEGGYALFRDPASAEAAALYGRHPRGLAPEASARLGAAGLLDSLQLGWRPCAVSAALVRAALPYLTDEIAARRSNAAHLRRALAASPWLLLPDELPGAVGCYHLLSLLLRDGAPVDPAGFQAGLARRGVDSFRYIPEPIHRWRRLDPEGYTGPRVFWHEQLRRAGVSYRHQSLPAAEQRCRRSLELGFNWTVEDPAAMAALGAALVTAANGD